MHFGGSSERREFEERSLRGWYMVDGYHIPI
jgi:hypothetical protein